MPIRVSCCKTSDCIGWTQFQDSSCTQYVTTTILIISSISLRYLDSFQCYNVCSVCEEGKMEKFSPKLSSLNIKQFCSIFFKMEIYLLSIYRTLLLKMSKYVVIRVESKRWAAGIYLTNKTKKNGIQILCWSSLGREKFVPGYGIEPILSISHPLIVFSWYAWSIYPKQTLYASIL